MDVKTISAMIIDALVVNWGLILKLVGMDLQSGNKIKKTD